MVQIGRISNDDVRDYLNYMFGGVSMPTAPATYYVGLSSTLPDNDGGNITEPSGDGYGRVSIANNTTTWGAAATTGRTRANQISIAFPQATGTWGDVSYFVLMDAATAGNMHAWGNLASTQTVIAENTPTFPVDSLVVDAPGT